MLFAGFVVFFFGGLALEFVANSVSWRWLGYAKLITMLTGVWLVFFGTKKTINREDSE